MGACCSKTDSTVASTPISPEAKIKPNPQQPEKKTNAAVTSAATVASPTEPEAQKKGVFAVNHRKSHEIDRHPDPETRKSIDRKKSPNSEFSEPAVTDSAGSGDVLAGAMVRTSSCTKEELDAILIQCGRLSRSSSGVNPVGGETPIRGCRRYSGSKRSFDFDMEMSTKNEDDVDGEQRRPPRVSSPSSRRRSREQRSGSKERGSNGGRRVSRSPNRRSESPNPNSNATVVQTGCGNNNNHNRPGKMVSVPATDKSNNSGVGDVAGVTSGVVKKIQVKRNAGEAVAAAGSRAAASPRSRSPAQANVRVLNENQNPQPLTLSRSNSRKAEHSPYRRNPLGEIDTNVVASEQQSSKKPNGNQTISRTRSSRLSRDLDINLETLVHPNVNVKLNPNPSSYASLLLEDIQNFHQKNPPTASPLPVCVTKACTILEAVADLKSATSSNDRQLKVVNDESLHKYVTVRRGGGDADTEEQESSGSNSFAGSQQLSWMSSSWEPNSGDSTDCWTSKSRSDVEVERTEYPRNGIGRGRVGVHGRSAYSLPNN